jgi:hypothetical protein
VGAVVVEVGALGPAEDLTGGAVRLADAVVAAGSVATDGVVAGAAVVVVVLEVHAFAVAPCLAGGAQRRARSSAATRSVAADVAAGAAVRIVILEVGASLFAAP